MSLDYEIITDPERLRDVVARARSAEAYALDTEFHRERTYFAKVCLVQLALGRDVYLIDPLAPAMGDALSLLRPLLEGPGCALVHACSQDLEILRNECGAAPTRLFDPQIAAAFLGLGTASLARVVSEILGVRMKKGAQLSDWTRRPLGASELRYAASDVVYLEELVAIQRERLIDRGRLGWCEEECERARLRDPGARDPRTLWWKLKGASRWGVESAGVAQELAALRDRIARERDIPIRRAIPDVALLSMIGKPPRGPKDLKRVRGLDRNQLRGREEEVLAAVARGLKLDTSELQRPPARSTDGVSSGVLALTMAWLTQRARDEGIDQATLATRSDVESLVIGQTETRLAKGWRAELVGDELKRLAAGEVAVVVRGERLALVERPA